ncbi:IS200/IS605 family transposase [Rickettsia endosymbiont of Urophora cardui]|uniref:IS200/IS605 family transposase n=1 Tax=Rickettsia endosymbiont of Urophora cardui TaxID=3066265 RepID=UPI00313D926B
MSKLQDKDHVHFLLQSIPMYSPTKITQIIKSITSKKMFEKYPNLKEKLWGSEFWIKGYFMSTVGKHGDEQKLPGVSHLAKLCIS